MSSKEIEATSKCEWKGSHRRQWVGMANIAGQSVAHHNQMPFPMLTKINWKLIAENTWKLICKRTAGYWLPCVQQARIWDFPLFAHSLHNFCVERQIEADERICLCWLDVKTCNGRTMTCSKSNQRKRKIKTDRRQRKTKIRLISSSWMSICYSSIAAIQQWIAPPLCCQSAGFCACVCSLDWPHMRVYMGFWFAN